MSPSASPPSATVGTMTGTLADGDGRGETILVVDDDPEIVNLLKLRFSKRGYRVVTAADGEAALEQAAAEHPALVVLDVMMPNKSGWEVARELRQNPDTQAIKIVMLTAIGKEMNDMTSPLYRVDAHLDKPFEFTELEDTVAGLLRSTSD
jgi:DNA-binding response OmpR family regulator